MPPGTGRDVMSGAPFAVPDFTHWSTHYRKPLTEWGRKQRAHHMAHHFGDHEKNFGLSHMWMDKILGTLNKRGEK